MNFPYPIILIDIPILCIVCFRTIESLYEELVMQGIIVRSPQVRLADYEGEYSYLGTTLRQANIEPMPSLSDVRRLVTEFGILPLGRYKPVKEQHIQNN